jgi:hypothetical protein
VPGFFQDVDPVHHLNDRLYRIVGGHLALVAVGDLLTDQDGAPHSRPVRGGGQQPPQRVHPAGRPVVRHSQPFDQPREHRGVAALLGQFGERVLHMPGGRVSLIGQLRQQAHQDAFKPDAEPGHAGGLMLTEFAALVLAEPFPHRGPVQRAAVLGQEELALLRRRGPVDVEFRVVGPGRRRAQQPVGQPLLVGPGAQFAGCHHRSPVPASGGTPFG